MPSKQKAETWTKESAMRRQAAGSSSIKHKPEVSPDQEEKKPRAGLPTLGSVPALTLPWCRARRLGGIIPPVISRDVTNADGHGITVPRP